VAVTTTYTLNYNGLSDLNQLNFQTSAFEAMASVFTSIDAT